MKTLITITLLIINLHSNPVWDNYPTGWQARAGHVAISGMSVLLLNELMYRNQVPRQHRINVSILNAILLGLFKEGVDYNQGGRFDWGDMRDNFIGIGISGVLIWRVGR